MRTKTLYEFGLIEAKNKEKKRFVVSIIEDLREDKSYEKNTHSAKTNKQNRNLIIHFTRMQNGIQDCLLPTADKIISKLYISQYLFIPKTKCA